MKSNEQYFGQFIHAVAALHYPGQQINSIKSLKDAIENEFDQAFRPDRDQISYLQRK